MANDYYVLEVDDEDPITTNPTLLTEDEVQTVLRFFAQTLDHFKSTGGVSVESTYAALRFRRATDTEVHIAKLRGEINE